MGVKRKLFLFFYYAVASHLPNFAFPLGRFFNWIRVKTLKRITLIGDGCRVMKKVYVGDGDRISIGDNCRINEGARLCNVRIGNNVLIARGHVFIGALHRYDDISIPMVEQEPKGDDKWGDPTIVEDDVWIGINVVILPGVKISKGCIIGAGSIVTKNTEPYGVYVGNPARLLRIRGKE